MYTSATAYFIITFDVDTCNPICWGVYSEDVLSDDGSYDHVVVASLKLQLHQPKEVIYGDVSKILKHHVKSQFYDSIPITFRHKIWNVGECRQFIAREREKIIFFENPNFQLKKNECPR